ncbi:PREDICTED: chaoptin-like, partial [Nicrophorus vespilloides]|uniref:Chaoptin-like n=1 Tax=Nicrophorus vespilloides TaxID=110193 RepID=A0ABM1MFI8_NICVS
MTTKKVLVLLVMLAATEGEKICKPETCRSVYCPAGSNYTTILLTGCTSAEEIIFDGNELDVNSWDDFRMSRIGKLSLRFNVLRDLPASAFANILIDDLILSHNELRVIKVDHFVGVSSLNALYLDNNLIEVVESIPSTRILDLSNNRIKTIGEDAFLRSGPNFCQYLYLKNNRLDNLRFLKNLSDLSVLDMSNNNITTLNNRTFPPMENLQVVDFSHNFIIHVDLDVAEFRSLRTFQILMSKQDELKIHWNEIFVPLNLYQLYIVSILTFTIPIIIVLSVIILVLSCKKRKKLFKDTEMKILK